MYFKLQNESAEKSGISARWYQRVTALIESGRKPGEVLSALIMEASNSIDKAAAKAALPSRKKIASRAKHLRRSKAGTWDLKTNADLLNAFGGMLHLYGCNRSYIITVGSYDIYNYILPMCECLFSYLQMHM